MGKTTKLPAADSYYELYEEEQDSSPKENEGALEEKDREGYYWQYEHTAPFEDVGGDALYGLAIGPHFAVTKRTVHPAHPADSSRLPKRTLAL